MTKDADFRNGHLLAGTPRRLLVVATGNIGNDSLIGLFEDWLEIIVEQLADADFLELQRDELIVHSRTPG